jgi:hypothetical protein
MLESLVPFRAQNHPMLHFLLYQLNISNENVESYPETT